jgi:predicted phosphodiesterase
LSSINKASWGYEMSLKDAERSLPKRFLPKVPKGFEPEIRWDGNKGSGFIDSQIKLTPEDATDPAIWSEIIADWGLSPDAVEIVDGSVHIRAWDTNAGEGEVKRLKYYRAQIRRRTEPDNVESVNVEKLIDSVMKRKSLGRLKKHETGNRAFVALFSDWQLGKSEGGGVEATIERIQLAQDIAIERIRELIAVGRAPSYVYICGMGDLVENCSGHYAMQAFTVQLTRREQKDLAIVLIDRFVELVVDNFPELQVVLLAVPGNHGENRNASGKSFTDWLDNDDLDVFSTTYRMYLKNQKRYKNVSMPQFDGFIQEDLTITAEIAGVPCTLAHGHQFGKNSSGGVGKIENWLKGQALGRTPASQCAIMFSGHYHHYLASEATGRQIFQCPAMDGGSKWFTSQTGANSPAGMLTLGVGLDYGARGWGDLQII